MISLVSVSHTESKNLHMMSVCLDLDRAMTQRISTISGAKCGNQMLGAFNYLNCLRELCVTATTAAVTAIMLVSGTNQWDRLQ